MLLIRIYNFFRGYITILVEGFYVERFINICTNRKIYLWGIRRISQTTMKVSLSLAAFKMLRPVAKKSKMKVKIVSKHGIPIKVYDYRHRKAFFVGILVCAVMFFVATSFVWKINVDGNNILSTEQIKTHLAALGVKEGVFKYTISTTELQNEMMAASDQIAWIGIEVRGTVINVSIREGKQKPEILDDSAPSNIIAKRDGVVTSLNLRSGVAAVKVGDTVTAGQLIVSGMHDSKITTRYSRAIASVVATTWYEKTMPVKLQQEEKKLTGKKTDRYYLKFFDFYVKLFINSGNPYPTCDKIEEVFDLSIGKDNIVPIALIKESFAETNVSVKNIDAKEAEQIGKDQLKKEFDLEFSGNRKILRGTTTSEMLDKNTVLVKLVLECSEEIGIESPMLQ